MARNKKITLVTSSEDILINQENDVGILYFCAPDNVLFRNNCKFILYSELIGDLNSTRQEACELATLLLKDEPKLRGVQQLTIFHESICVELHNLLHVIYLHDYLVATGYNYCEFISPSWWATELAKVIEILKSPLTINPLIQPHNSQLKRIISRLYTFGVSISSIKAGLNAMIRVFDPYHIIETCLLKKPKKVAKKQYWFYTTGENYTKSALEFEPAFLETFCYLVENKAQLKKLSSKNKQHTYSCYSYSKFKYIPKAKEITTSKNAITKHLQKQVLSHKHYLARQLFFDGPWLLLFMAKLLPKGLYSSSIFKNWLKMSNPSVVIVGNQVHEGYVLYQAQALGIPTLLLQHGVIGDYFRYSDYPINKYIIKGPCFYERLSSISQERGIIFNPHFQNNNAHLPGNKKFITFISMPIYMSHPNLDIDLNAILLAIIRAVAGSSKQLNIRVHPHEKVSDYQKITKQILSKHSLNIEIKYSEGEGLQELLLQSEAVISFASTVFLDCLRYNIPIIGINWYDFSLKSCLVKKRVFHFAKNLDELMQLVIQATHGRLTQNQSAMPYFLADSNLEDFRRELTSIIF